jgi:hypothetical protein
MVGLPDTSERGPFNYHNSKVLFNFDRQFQRRIFLNDFLGELGIICILIKDFRRLQL